MGALRRTPGADDQRGAQRGIRRLEPLMDFMPEEKSRLAQKGLGRTDTGVLIGRSVDRSSRGANRLADDGCIRCGGMLPTDTGHVGRPGHSIGAAAMLLHAARQGATLPMVSQRATAVAPSPTPAHQSAGSVRAHAALFGLIAAPVAHVALHLAS